VNEAAERLANALVESYRVLAERGASGQELNAELTQQFFDRVIDNLQAQAGDTQEMTQALAEQLRRGQETSQQLTQESLSAYMDFVNSMFSYFQAAPQAAQRGAGEAGR
jgi:hypothetical protein